MEDSLLEDPAPASGATVLLEPGTGLLEVLATACSMWEREGAIVLVEEGVPVTDSLLTGERVTIRPGSA
ncbi:hypothetical protein [Arthrobacter sp. RIT-PI-e]|uniref:hypothetical protein n=1 Tax=Arthrobacter sp. RIT-PI-e TaxID=1681197 RepID=UPI00128F32BE|nr:hypothetical protein [Arthrobacter sp. RIT-PI-e]